MRNVEILSVPIALSRGARRPLHDQIVEALRYAIDTGQLRAGSRLPSTRTLAGMLGVSRGVATTAYEELSATGAIHGTPGSGTYVSGSPAQVNGRTPARDSDLVDLRPGRSITEDFPLAAWRAAWRQASYDPPPPGHPPGGGLARLRAAVTEHVRRLRGYAAEDGQVVITSGPRHALDAILQALPGQPRCALADPGPPWLRAAVAVRGHIVPVPTDADGMRVEQIPPGVDIVIAVPDGGIPLGHRAPAGRREQFARWAERTGGWLLEVGRDATTDPLAPPLPSLITLGPPARTALLGDLGELLTPAIGLGYLVLPHRLAHTLAGRIAAAGEQPPVLNQFAAVELFRTGDFARRRTRLATIHTRKLAVVKEILDPAGLEPLDTQVPGSATVFLPNDLIGHGRRAGILLTALRECYTQQNDAPDGLVIGFGHLEDSLLRKALRAVVATVDR